MLDGASTQPLRELRAGRQLSIRELARLAGVAPSTVYLTETGRTTPHASVMRRIAAALGVDARAVAEFRRAIEAHAGRAPKPGRGPTPARISTTPRPRRTKPEP